MKNKFKKFYVAFFCFFLSITSHISHAGNIYQPYSYKKKQNNPFLFAVNQKFFTYKDFENRYNLAVKLLNLKELGNAESRVLKKKIAQKIIDEQLISENGKKLNIVVEQAEIKKALDAFLFQRKISLKGFKSYLKKNDLNFDTLFEQFRVELIWSKIVEEIIKPKIRTSQIEAREFIEQKKIAEKVVHYHLAELVIDDSDSSSEKFSESLLKELQNGANFESMVQQFSILDPTKKSGEIGWYSQKDINSKILSALKDCKKGQYSKLVKISDKYHIFKILDTKFDFSIDEDDMNMALNNVFIQKLEIMTKSYLYDLRKSAYIEIFDDELAEDL